MKAKKSFFKERKFLKSFLTLLSTLSLSFVNGQPPKLPFF